MRKKKEESERIRKAYAPDGTRTQKMMSFKVDLDNWAWLETKVNKGRYINNLIAADRARIGPQENATRAAGQGGEATPPAP